DRPLHRDPPGLSGPFRRGDPRDVPADPDRPRRSRRRRAGRGEGEMILPWITASVILVALVVYAILGGADFGGGLWDLLASGPRARRQRELITEAIAPVWEANHVWLIVVIVLLFTCFPLAFSVISIALHVPLALMLLGIVMRAAAFVFRHYDVAGDPVQRRWGQIFAWSSIITPLFLGICVG